MDNGWKAVLVSTETRIERGGELRFEEAKAEAVAYLTERIERLRDPPASLRAGLRLTLLRILAMDEGNEERSKSSNHSA